MTGVVLEGSFQSVAKTTTGKAQIIREGDDFQLRLVGVTLEANPPIHVYLVGLPMANTSRAVISTETKYDFGPLDQAGAEQIISLPSEPAPEVRSVVLWNPKFGVNLAWAPLLPK